MGKIPLEFAEKIPSPEEVFGRPMTWRNKLTVLWGSAVIALGVSIGSGEFLLGPAQAIRAGLGMLWLVLVGAFLQTVYIYSWVRIATALGETPIATMFRIGAWAGVLGLVGVFASFVWGGWAYTSAVALAGGLLGRVPGPGDRLFVGLVGTALLVLAFVILSLGRRVARTLEFFNWFDLGILFPLFIILAAALAGLGAWQAAAVGLVSFGYIPPGIDISILPAWWGYIGFATAANYVITNWFKDKGFGMGALTGYIPAIIGGKKVELSPVGKLFRPTPENLAVYRRWNRLALEELFVIFFMGAVVGMVVPMTLAYGIARGAGLTVAWGIPLWLADALNKLWGSGGWALGVLMAILVLFKTQIGVADALTRAWLDTLWRMEGVRRFFRNDVRYIYYLVLAVILAWASVAFWVTAPGILIVIAASMANLASLWAIPFLIYINRILPKEIRLHWGIIALNLVFMAICVAMLALFFGVQLGLVK